MWMQTADNAGRFTRKNNAPPLPLWLCASRPEIDLPAGRTPDRYCWARFERNIRWKIQITLK